MCRFCPCILQVMLSALITGACSPVAGEGLVEFYYHETLVIKQQGSPSLILLNGHADPVLYKSKAYLTAWKLDSIDQLNDYLTRQAEARIARPRGVDESRSSQFVVDGPTGATITVFGSQITWIPNGHASGNLSLERLKQPVKIAVLNQAFRSPFSENDFLTLAEHAKRHAIKEAKRRKELLHELRLRASEWRAPQNLNQEL